MKISAFLFIMLFLQISNCNHKQELKDDGECIGLRIISNATRLSLSEYKYDLCDTKVFFSYSIPIKVRRDFEMQFILDSIIQLETVDYEDLIKDTKPIYELPDTSFFSENPNYYSFEVSYLKIENVKDSINKVFIDYIPESMLPFVLKMKELTHSEEFAYWQENAIPDSIYYKNISIKD